MILDAPSAANDERLTLDDLFRRAGVREPQRLALIDPPNRARIDGRAPRALTFAQADRAIAALAARLRELGLATDAVVGIQLPNTVESAIALLGVLRAGMIAAPLPLLWRKQDMTAALGLVAAKAIITHGCDADPAMQTAAELFPIRYVCGFGQALPDGVVPLDDCFAPGADGLLASPRPGKAADHVAIITFDVTADGLAPVSRSHAGVAAAGRAVFEASPIAPDSNFLSAIVPGTFAAIALGIVPWLLAGGTLALHHSFDAETFAAQSHALGECNMVLPGPLLPMLDDAGLLDADAKTIIALWRAPGRLADAPAWQGEASLVDVTSLGETGLVAMRRTADGKPAPVTGGANGGMVDVGGYRFRQPALDAEVASVDPEATILVLPNALAGERLIGTAADPGAVRLALEQRGANPLISGAFRARKSDAAA